MQNIIKRALISVSDKTNLIELAKKLSKLEIELISTGGSAKTLRDEGISVTEVSDYTGFPEIMGGRVKTLHPKIHGGVLSRRDCIEDTEAMLKHSILNIDLVIVNLYPFEEAIKLNPNNIENCIENIDIGGPSMIRSAAKNHHFITIVVDPKDYDNLTNELNNNNCSTTLSFRKGLAEKAFQRTAAYDIAIGTWFSNMSGNQHPERLNFSGTLKQELRYGENPHQTAAFYANSSQRPGVATSKQTQGKELSFNNLNDTDAAYELVAEFKNPTCAIIKHANPCGVSTDKTLSNAYKKALSCDPESAFGGIIAFNKILDVDTATEIINLFAEVVIAPEIDSEASKILAKKKNLRVLVAGTLPNSTQPEMTIRTLAGGYLIQRSDSLLTDGNLTVVTKRKPSEKEMNDLIFAFTVCKHVKSNAIVYAKNQTTVGIGAGQMSRVNSSRIAAWKAQDASTAAGESVSRTHGSVVASDAFFPFSDGLLAAASAGITAVIQPGGSIRDDEVIATANDQNITMIFSGMRHFKH
ncbi:MAG: bifunctional phosphoribosylaminoimidazolecarboxamide formyltransferase/IMP cyclohydrolase [Rhodospirillales bacterium]|tara:strand:- start:153 stop:1727 length:1575 start_codon:yes stop_codon:yes gene_type:complete